MKTIKGLLLTAFASLALVGCVKDQPYDKGTEVKGEGLYISNKTTVFKVQSAEDKYNDVLSVREIDETYRPEVTGPEYFNDDFIIEVDLHRSDSASSSAMYVDVCLTLYRSDAEYLHLSAEYDWIKTDENGYYDTYTYTAYFAKGATKASVPIEFEVGEMSPNYEIECLMEFSKDQPSFTTSTYGSDSFEFSIMRSAVVNLPFTKIGSVSLTEDMLAGGNTYSNIEIQIHDDDLAAIRKARQNGTTPELEFGAVRFMIPRFMYQIALASVRAGDGMFDTDELAEYALGDHLLLPMTLDYKPVEDMSGHTHPIFTEMYRDHPEYHVYQIYPVMSVEQSGEMPAYYAVSNDYLTYLGSIPVYDEYGEVFFIWFPTMDMPGYCAYSSTANKFVYETFYWSTSSDYGYLYPVTLTMLWTVNELEDDWDNYFNVDYNEDIDYAAAGKGTFTSSYIATSGIENNSAEVELNEGYESMYGKSVYYLANTYEAFGAEAGFGLAVISSDGRNWSVADNQPTGLTLLGRALYASQSDSIATTVDTSDPTKISMVLGVALGFDDGIKIGDFEETFEYASSSSVDKFCGTYVQTLGVAPDSDDDPVTTTVTIERVGDTNEVTISGLLSAELLEDDELDLGTLTGVYNPLTDCIVIEAQYIKTGKPWSFDGKTYYPHFVPAATDYVEVYLDEESETTGFVPDVVEERSSCALYFDEDGLLTFGNSPMAGLAPGAEPTDGYRIDVYAYDRLEGALVNEGYMYIAADVKFAAEAAKSSLSKAPMTVAAPAADSRRAVTRLMPVDRANFKRFNAKTL